MGLFVTHNNEPVSADKFILLYMPAERAPLVQEYLDKNNLAKKFNVIRGTVSTELRDAGETESSLFSKPIDTLVLIMTSDKVLFEYILSGKRLELLTKITEYVNGSEEKE